MGLPLVHWMLPVVLAGETDSVSVFDAGLASLPLRETSRVSGSEREAICRSLTVTVTVAFLSPHVAVMTALPLPLAVTRPVSSFTVATLTLSLVHLTASVVPSGTSAVSCTLSAPSSPLMTSSFDAGVTLRLSAAFSTVTAQLAVTVS